MTRVDHWGLTLALWAVACTPPPPTGGESNRKAENAKARVQPAQNGDRPEEDDASCERCGAESCTPGAAKACMDLARAHRHGKGVAFDMKLHGDLAEKSCNGGYAPACSTLGILFQDGLGGREHSDAKARQLHQQACERGAGIGCFNLAMMIEAGGDGPADPDRAQPWYDKARERFTASCDAGEHEWCANLGFMLDSGMGVAQNPTHAVEAYEKGCPQHFNNCTNLALMKLDGRGTNKDIEGARVLFERGCDADNEWACAFYGMSLLAGRGFEANPAAAVPILTKACDLKEKVGCSGLASAHGLGLGVEQDLDKALALNEYACELGDSAGCRGAAMELVNRPNSADSARMRSLFDAGCKIGDGEACGILAVMYANGIGAEKPDAKRAEALWMEGCRRMDPKSCNEVLRLGLTPEVIDERKPMIYDIACRSGIESACGTAEANSHAGNQ